MWCYVSRESVGLPALARVQFVGRGSWVKASSLLKRLASAAPLGIGVAVIAFSFMLHGRLDLNSNLVLMGYAERRLGGWP